jgi:predicted transposase YbfD/YdcC
MAARDRLDTTFAAVQKFPGVVALARITSRRRALGGRAEPPQVRYFLLSKYIPAKRLLHIVRSHWGIENQLHWVLDVVFNEDRNRTRKDNAPENLAILRKLALNLVRSHPAATSLRQKIKRAGWDDAFLLGMLSHMR